MNSTIRSETSTITRQGDASTHAAHWSRRDNAVCRRRERGHNSCSGIDGASCQSDCEGHRGRCHNWSRGHGRPAVLPLETGTARGMLIPMPHTEGRHNSKKVCDPLPSRVKNRGGGTPLGHTSTISRSTLMVISPYRYKSHFSLRHLPST